MNRYILYTNKENPPVGEEVVLYILKDKIKPNRELIITEDYSIFNAIVKIDKLGRINLMPMWIKERYLLSDISYWSFTERISAYKSFAIRNLIKYRTSLKLKEKWIVAAARDSRTKEYIKIYPDDNFGLIATDIISTVPYGMELVERFNRGIFY